MIPGDGYTIVLVVMLPLLDSLIMSPGVEVLRWTKFG